MKFACFAFTYCWSCQLNLHLRIKQSHYHSKRQIWSINDYLIKHKTYPLPTWLIYFKLWLYIKWSRYCICSFIPIRYFSIRLLWYNFALICVLLWFSIHILLKSQRSLARQTMDIIWSSSSETTACRWVIELHSNLWKSDRW